MLTVPSVGHVRSVVVEVCETGVVNENTPAVATAVNINDSKQHFVLQYYILVIAQWHLWFFSDHLSEILLRRRTSYARPVVTQSIAGTHRSHPSSCTCCGDGTCSSSSPIYYKSNFCKTLNREESQAIYQRITVDKHADGPNTAGAVHRRLCATRMAEWWCSLHDKSHLIRGDTI